MRISVFDNIENKDKNAAIETLINRSTPYQDFFLLVLLAMFMATIGILMNNVAIIIGSMLIAPVLYPIMGIAMGTVMADRKLIMRSIATFWKSVALSLIAAGVITLIMYPPGGTLPLQITPELLLRTQPTLPDAAIAIIAGLAASFALVKPLLSETLPGVAISVALVPPLGVVGIGLATLNWDIAIGAFILFLVNTLGILFACVMIFSIMNFYVKRPIATEAIKKEDKELVKIEKKAEEKSKKDK